MLTNYILINFERLKKVKFFYELKFFLQCCTELLKEHCLNHKLSKNDLSKWNHFKFSHIFFNKLLKKLYYFFSCFLNQ